MHAHPMQPPDMENEMKATRKVPRVGITLVETLIVIFIIAILVQLLIPAVQQARSAARRTQCQNNLHQLAIGAQGHLSAQGFFPSGGWSCAYTADPNRGYGREQPGGWAYNLLAYIEETELRELGTDESMTADELGPGLRKLHESAPSVLYCTDRRPARPYPPVSEGKAKWGLAAAKNVPFLPAVTKSDYAANTGDSLHHAASSFGAIMWWPRDYAALKSEPPAWTDTDDSDSKFYQTGVVYYRSEVRPENITDGISNTYLFGEKYMDPLAYEDIHGVPEYARLGDNQSAWAGFDWDNQRVAWNPDATKRQECYQPQQDSGSVCRAIWSFGSAHAGAMNMAFCDGSVKQISYDIDPEVHRRSANRMDGER